MNKKDSSRHEHACSCHHVSRRDFLAGMALAGSGLILPGNSSANGVQQLSGSVFVNRRYAAVGTPVNPGDMVTVAHGGTVAFTIGEDAYLLRGGTTMLIETGNSALIQGLRLLAGAVLGVFGKGDKRITTRTATIGIRGTGLYLDTAPDKTYFCTCYGETELRVDNMKPKVLTATHHNAVMIYTPPDGDNRIHNMAGFEYHTDDELRATEALQGRKVPFDT